MPSFGTTQNQHQDLSGSDGEHRGDSLAADPREILPPYGLSWLVGLLHQELLLLLLPDAGQRAPAD